MAERTSISTASRSTWPVLRRPVKRVPSRCSTSRATSCRIASAVFFRFTERLLFHRPQTADLLIDLDQLPAEPLVLTEFGDLSLGLAHCRWIWQGFRHRLAMPLVR